MKLRTSAFSLIELLVVLGVVSALLAILVPTISSVRRSARATQCQSNLRQLGIALKNYAAENRGVIPRAGHFYNPRFPIWITSLGPYLIGRPFAAWSEISASAVLHCPEQVLQGLPTSFNLNAFAFDSSPSWRGSPPTPLGSMRNPSTLPLLVEAKDRYDDDHFFTGSTWIEAHRTVEKPDHLQLRLTWVRHRAFSNVLMTDGHVTRVRFAIPLEQYDDGISNRQFARSITIPTWLD